MKIHQVIFILTIMTAHTLSLGDNKKNNTLFLTRRKGALIAASILATSIGVYTAAHIYKSLIKQSPLDDNKGPKKDSNKEIKEDEKAVEGYVLSSHDRSLFNDTNLAPRVSADGKTLMLQQYTGHPFSDDYTIEHKLNVQKPVAVLQTVHSGSHFFASPYEGGASNAVRYLQRELKDNATLLGSISQIIIVTDEPIDRWNAEEWGEPEGFAPTVTILINPKDRFVSRDLFWSHPVRNVGEHQVLIFIPSKK